jgi:hypothetical protein
MADSDSIKLCECGCGQPAPLAKQTIKKRGYARGLPLRFISGHNARVMGPPAPPVTHGMHGTTEYKIWDLMLYRCRNPRNRAWKNYGGRGIAVCERWHKFENFYADMGPRPSLDHSLDRIDNDGNYEPSNCRWATELMQKNNRRDNVVISHDGRSMSVAQWARALGIADATLRERYKRGLRPPRLFSTGDLRLQPELPDSR